MVGIVIVSHSRLLAEGVAELARQLAGNGVPIAVAGGLDDPDKPIGTDAARVVEAIEEVDSPDGVLVLMDLGSAVLSAETARDLLAPEVAQRVLLCDAPLVEGAVAAVVQARLGASLAEVAEEARRGLLPKAEHLRLAAPSAPSAQAAETEPTEVVRLTVSNPLGLHARPAARFVETVAQYDARVTVVNLTTGVGPASARSLTALAALGVRRGHEIQVRASGPGALKALEAVIALHSKDFYDRPEDRAPAEVLTASALQPTLQPSGALQGVAASPGMAAGPTRHLRTPRLAIPEEPAADPEAAWRELEAALKATKSEIEGTRRMVQAKASEQGASIFDAHLLLLTDEELLSTARRLILVEGHNPAHAWQLACQVAANALRQLADPYLAERATDIEAVAAQVIAQLLGVSAIKASISQPGVVVAPELTPAETAALDPALVRGVATAGSGPTSHAAILARALGIPAVVALGAAILEVSEETMLLVDGDRGIVVINPDEELILAAQVRQEADQEADLARRRAAAFPAVTRDGLRVEVAANLGSLREAEVAVEMGAESVGLLRTEFLFLDRDQPPCEEEQYYAYLAIAEILAGRRLVLRTLDVGGDKPLPYLARPPEANPFLGVRGLRLALSHPELLTKQLRAALRVARLHPLSIMFPMVTTVKEFLFAKRLVAEEAGRVKTDLATVEVGLMVEVPAAALMVHHLAEYADFFSIGTNDLTQYALAAERGNPDLAALTDALHPAVLSLISATARAAKAKERWVGVCGEVAGDPAATALLVGLGVSELSMAVSAIPLIKERVRGLDSKEAHLLAQCALKLPSAEAVRELVAST